jgi:hypothetical protein
LRALRAGEGLIVARKPNGKAEKLGRFVALPFDVLDSKAYVSLSANARALLFEAARAAQSGPMNGRVCLSKAKMAPRGWTSSDMLHKAKRELMAVGLLHEVTKGKRPNKASGYAVTWRSLDHGADAQGSDFRRGAYQSFARPPGGPEGPAVGPPHGLERPAPRPSHGPMRAALPTSPGPPDGPLLEKPSTCDDETEQPAGPPNLREQARQAIEAVLQTRPGVRARLAWWRAQSAEHPQATMTALQHAVRFDAADVHRNLAGVQLP